MKEVKKITAGNSLEISNLAKEIQVDELLTLFQQFGEIANLSIKWDAKIANRCSAVIEYPSKKEAVNAKEEYDGAELDKNIISIKLL